uniref:Dirigent protein n=1 Tax=Agrostis stolonifera TaxID=63632 RepID=Q4U3G6_AGRST|nr:Crs-1 [Agrostis stolonifera]
MANPSYYQTSPPVRSQVLHQEHLFHLYAHQQMGNNEFNIVPAKPGLPNYFGQSNVFDWDIRDSPDIKATVIGRLQGLGIAARKSSQSWHNTSNLVFTDQRFKGSTLTLQGLLGPATLGDEGDWAIVGGTGEFVYAQGVCNYKRIQAWDGGVINELCIRVVCLTFPKPIPVQKVGPWGGNGGAAYEIQDAELPQRLESVTIYANDFIQTIAFSYIDQAGQKRTVSPWGGNAGKSQHPPIQLGTSETVKEIYGATGDYYGVATAVTWLTIVTNVKTYGPYGKQSAGETPFHIVAPNNHSIVGFYGRVGEVLDQIGAYVSPN